MYWELLYCWWWLWGNFIYWRLSLYTLHSDTLNLWKHKKRGDSKYLKMAVYCEFGAVNHKKYSYSEVIIRRNLKKKLLQCFLNILLKWQLIRSFLFERLKTEQKKINLSSDFCKTIAEKYCSYNRNRDVWNILFHVKKLYSNQNYFGFSFSKCFKLNCVFGKYFNSCKLILRTNWNCS